MTVAGIWSAHSAGLSLAAWAMLSFHAPARGVDTIVQPPAQAASTAASPSVEEKLAARVSANPDDAAAWRMLGRIRFNRGNYAGAHEALNRATMLDPLSIAAAYDLGRTLLKLNRPLAARRWLEQVVTDGPDTDYALQAAELLAPLDDAGTVPVEQAGYETRRFDATERIEQRLTPQSETRRWFSDSFISIEVGTQYNNNVALSPLSRDLAPGTPDSFQFLFAPNLELNVYEAESWRTGVTYGGDFTLNEGGFSQFNLQSYRPGAYLESDVTIGSTIVVPRLDYEFGLDEFDGDTFATRHRGTASALALWNEQHSTLGFWSLDDTNFRNDGAVPWITSRDGWSTAVGANHEILTPERWTKSLRGSIQYEHADADGADYRFNGIEFGAGVVIPVAWQCEASLRAGWGLRDYPDFVTGPARNEHLLNGGVEISRPFAKGLSAAVVFSYDRFFSDNARFDAERVIGGVLLRYDR